MEYIVRGSKNRNNIRLILERVCRNERATFRSASTGPDRALVVCDWAKASLKLLNNFVVNLLLPRFLPSFTVGGMAERPPPPHHPVRLFASTRC